MIKASDSEAKQLIQKRLLQTIAASLVDQLGRSGFHWSEIVELANELLEHIIELQVSSMSSSSSIPVRGSDPSVFAPEWARARSLHVAGHVSLDSSAYVRWLKQADLASLVRWQADEVISRTLATKSLEYIVAQQQQNGRREMRTCLTICRKADERPIGLVGLINLDEEPRQAELTKMIGDVAERGRGYARMATRVLLAYAFEWLGVDRVFLRTTGRHRRWHNARRGHHVAAAIRFSGGGALPGHGKTPVCDGSVPASHGSEEWDAMRCTQWHRCDD